MAGAPVSSSSRFAARPVGAARATLRPCPAAIATTAATVRLLPVPGPPVRTETPCSATARTAVCWAASRSAAGAGSAPGPGPAFRAGIRGGQRPGQRGQPLQPFRDRLLGHGVAGQGQQDAGRGHLPFRGPVAPVVTGELIAGRILARIRFEREHAAFVHRGGDGGRRILDPEPGQGAGDHPGGHRGMPVPRRPGQQVAHQGPAAPLILGAGLAAQQLPGEPVRLIRPDLGQRQQPPRVLAQLVPGGPAQHGHGRPGVPGRHPAGGQQLRGLVAGPGAGERRRQPCGTVSAYSVDELQAFRGDQRGPGDTRARQLCGHFLAQPRPQPGRAELTEHVGKIVGHQRPAHLSYRGHRQPA